VPKRPRSRQCGIALVAVLWIVAALAVVVGSVSRSVTQEVRGVSLARQSVAAQALGHGAIRLALQELVARPAKPLAITSSRVSYRGLEIFVRVSPLNGLIDLNEAPAALLAQVFVHAGGLPAERAAALAAAAVQARSIKDTRGVAIGFESKEDLLQLPGVDYTLYAKISRLLTADLKGTGRVNPMASPESVLTVLSAGDSATAARISSQRDEGRVGVDTTTLNGEFIDSNMTQRFHLQARVQLSGGRWLLVSQTVDLGGGSGGMPWRTIHAEHALEPAVAE
jgi:general secretion pathway protein K